MAETDIAYCLTRVGQAAVDWRTLVVAGSGTCPASAAELWAVWCDLERWPAWSPIHRSVAVVDAMSLSVGGSFDQELGLGFHDRAGQARGREAVESPVPGAVDGLIAATAAAAEVHPHEH